MFNFAEICNDGKYRYIYLIKNDINGKTYVGQHTTKELRDGYFGSGTILNKAIEKYGKENFELGYLAFCETKEELNEQEKLWIDYFQHHETRGNYNIAKGGRGGDLISNHPRNKEIRKRISEIHKGKIVSEESRKRMSIARKGKTCGENNPFFGKHHSKETLDKIKEKIAIYNKTHTIWNKGLVGVQQRTKESIVSGIKNNKKVRPIIQFTLNGEFVKRYDFNPKIFYGILACCKGKIRQSNNYIWLYEDEYLGDNSLINKRIELLNKPLDLLICPHCKFESTSKINMSRWHFDNCKKNPNYIDKRKIV